MKELLIIFTRNPEHGKCKTRLAATLGDEAALEIYKFLLEHTVMVTKSVKAKKKVFYSEEIWEADIWDTKEFEKKLQSGSHLGLRMRNAFEMGFESGFQRIVLIGSDLYDLQTEDIEEAFTALKTHDFVLGPAQDGGYYLLGMRTMRSNLFENKNWGTSTVLDDTLANLHGESVLLLPERNDVDVYEDIAHIEAFQKFLSHIK